MHSPKPADHSSIASAALSNPGPYSSHLLAKIWLSVGNRRTLFFRACAQARILSIPILAPTVCIALVISVGQVAKAKGLADFTEKPNDHTWRLLNGKGTTNIRDLNPNDPFLKGVSEEDIAVINHFGVDAASRLLHYCNSLHQAAIRMGIGGRPPLSQNSQYIGEAEWTNLLTNSRFLALSSQESLSAIRIGGYNVFMLLNRYANLLENKILESIKRRPQNKSFLKNLKIIPPGHTSDSPSLDVAIIDLINEARVNLETGKFGESMNAWSKLRLWAERSYGSNHISVAVVLSKQAEIYQNQSLFNKAEASYLQALRIQEANNQSNTQEYADNLVAIASLYLEMGLYQKSEHKYEQALLLLGRRLGSNDVAVVHPVLGLAYLHSLRGDDAKAQSYYSRAYQVSKRETGDLSASTSSAAYSYAMHLAKIGRFSQAEELLAQSYTGYEGISMNNSPIFADILIARAKIFSSKGKTSQAEKMFHDAIRSFRDFYGNENSRVIKAIGELAYFYLSNGFYKKIDSLLGEGLALESNLIQRESPFLRKEDRHSYLASRRTMNMVAAARSLQGENLAGPALFSRLNRHGLLEEIEQRQMQLAALPGPQLLIADELKSLNTSLGSISATAAQRQALRARQGELEQQLYRLLPELKPRIVEVSEVASALPEGSALVEFQKYRTLDASKPWDRRWGAFHYQALILKPDQTISAIPLGTAAQIELAIHQSLNASSQNTSDSQAIWMRVTEKVLKPLAPFLVNINQLFLSPDSELNRIPFAALPYPHDPAKALGKAVHLRVLTTGRELLRLKQPSKAAQAPLVVANPSFDRVRRSKPALVLASSSERPQSRSSDLGAKAWAPLPATEREGQQVGTLLAARPITGAAATSSSLQQLNAPRVLHIATHGFFVSDVKTQPNDPLLAVQEQSALLRPFRGEDPQLRSGLVLAGANQPDADPNDDGYLTAAEAVGLKLDGTELVVLSACSTGQGDIRTGEGVYGLQRALTVAGSRSTLLSMWKVEDAATAEFMVRFYKRLKAGDGRADALAAVQGEFRDGAVQGPRGEDWSNPYFWAAWQLTGDWRPIPGL